MPKTSNEIQINPNLLVQAEIAANEGAFGNNGINITSNSQIKAGNYKKGRFDFNGIEVVIEQPRYSYRTGIGHDGKRWTSRLAAHYGYFSKTIGADGDNVDVFVGPFLGSENCYIINQFINGKFDEHKCLIGFGDDDYARQAYIDSYDKGWPGLHSMVKASITQLKWWLKNGNLKKPLAPNHLPFEGYESMQQRVSWNASGLPDNMTLDQIIYQIRRTDKTGNNLLLDSVSIKDILEEADEILVFDALVSTYAKLETKMNALLSVMARAGGDVKPLAMQISEPFKQNGVAQVAAVFELSDGQTVSIYFHNPDVTPQKLAPADEMISWKWLLNKKDITIVVAPERGQDINVRQVATRIMKLAEKNSAAFAKANTKRAENMAAIESIKEEIVVLEKELSDVQHELEVAKVEAEDRAARTGEVDPNLGQVTHKVKDFEGKEYEFNSAPLLANEAGSVSFKGDFLMLNIIVTPAMKKMGINKISETPKKIDIDPVHGEVLETTANGNNPFKIKLSDKPELKALAESYFQIKKDQAEYKDKIAEEKRQKEQESDNALLQKMEEDYQDLRKQIPEGMVEVEFKEAGSFDGEQQYEASANGIKLNFNDYTSIGWAQAIRPGALAAFKSKQVAYISPEKLEEIKAKNESKEKKAYDENKASFDKISQGKTKEEILAEIASEANKIHEYDLLNNGGGDGYNPHKARVDDLEWAVSNYEKFQDELTPSSDSVNNYHIEILKALIDIGWQNASTTVGELFWVTKNIGGGVKAVVNPDGIRRVSAKIEGGEIKASHGSKTLVSVPLDTSLTPDQNAKSLDDAVNAIDPNFISPSDNKPEVINPQPTETNEQENQQTEVTQETETAGEEGAGVDNETNTETESPDPNDMRGLAFAIEKDGVLITSGSVPKLIEKSETTDIDYYKKMADQVGGNLYIGGITTEKPIDTSGLIFGMTWEELQDRQNKQYKPKTVKAKMPDDAVMVYSAQSEVTPEPEPTVDPNQPHIDTLQAIVDGQHDGYDLTALLDVIEKAAQALIDAGLEKQYESLMSAAIDKWVALDQQANG